MPLDRISEIIEAENYAISDFTPRWERAKENARFYALDPYTEDQKNRLRKQNRQPFNFDKTSHAMNVLLGTQREGRLDIQFLERTQEDSAKTEVLNSVWKYYADTNEFLYRESDVFQDGVVNQCGIFGIKIDKSKYYAGDLKVYRVPFDQVLWDTNSRTYDLSWEEGTGANWFSHREFFRRNELIVQYPNAKELINLAGKDAQGEPQARPLRYDLWYDEKKELVGVRNFYERDYKRKYLIWQEGSEVPEEQIYATKKEAVAEIQDRIAQFSAFSAQIFSASGQMLPVPSFDILEIDCPIVTKTVAMINGVLEDKKEFALGEFPYSLYFAYYNDGDYWTAIERMKDPQMFYNRMFMQLDHWVGVSAKGLLRKDPRLTKRQSDDIDQKWGKTGGTFTAPAGRVELIESRGPLPQLFSMMDRAENIMDETFGGGNALGLKQTASESGRAVLARQAQAGLDNFVPLDNLRRTKLDLGKKIAWFLTHEITTARKLRITGNSLELQRLIQGGIAQPHDFKPNVAYVEINTRPENTIENLEVDVIVSEAQYSPSKMIASLSAMTDAFKSGMVSQPPPPEIAIGLLPIPEEYKQKWLALYQEKPPETKVALNVSYKDMPPQAQAQVEEMIGIQPAPEENVAQKVAEIKSKQKPELTEKEKSGAGSQG